MWPLRRFNQSFYAFQTLVSRVLLGWGSACVALGLAALPNRDPFTRQFGVQSLAWGAINAAIALVGLRDVRQKQALRTDAIAQARRFRLVVLLNGLLDVGYLAAGFTLLRRANGRPERAGMGFGIIVQGGFLLLFDLALALLSGRWTRSR